MAVGLLSLHSHRRKKPAAIVENVENPPKPGRMQRSRGICRSFQEPAAPHRLRCLIGRGQEIRRGGHFFLFGVGLARASATMTTRLLGVIRKRPWLATRPPYLSN